ncbi:MAG: 5-(carboxyamino)imidazole ribonucleotide mutase [Pyramidobacter sp.]|nr:5-(carboxyamino)imidazole ribonucleotide mutase [Pyramidobacter sp.]
MDYAAKVGIILGSASDLPHARKIGDTLNELNVPFEVTIASAHRTPDDAVNYAKNARARGLEVIIAVAGLSAALPGAIAAQTTLPVVGVPVESGSLLGMDALLSTAMMPPGVPVASVGINAAANAALLAARIVATHDAALTERLQKYADKKACAVRAARTDESAFAGLPMAPAEALE